MKHKMIKLYQFIFYKIVFRVFKLFPINNQKVIYISHYGNRFGCNPRSMFDYIYQNHPALQNVIVLNDKSKHAENKNTKYVSYYSLSFLYELATAKYWVVNTNLHPDLAPRAHTVYFQTWHGAGAFKKFGLDLPSNREKEKESWNRDTSQWTKMISSSENIIDIYAGACGIDKEKIFPTGVPRNDVFFQTQNVEDKKKEFYRAHHISENKKMILYAPTYRDVGNEDPIKLDFAELERELGEEYVFVLKLHPFLAQYKIHTTNDGEPFVLNLSALEDIQELLLIADVLVTDYSSVIFDFAITGKPILFYSYDLKDYERGFYFEYKDFVPGPIAYTQGNLVEYLKDYEQLYTENNEKVLKFAREFNSGFDGKATERAVQLLLSES